MNLKAGQQPEVLETISRQISNSEAKRRKLRFEHNLTAFMQGDVQILARDEFITDLRNLAIQGSVEKDSLRRIIIALGKAATYAEKTIRERTLALLSLVAQRALDEQDPGKIVLLVHGLSSWLEIEQEVLPGVEIVVKRIEELTMWLLERSAWKEATDIIELLARIDSKKLEKTAALRSLAGKSLGALAAVPLVEMLTENYLKEDDKGLSLDILKSLGKRAAPVVLQLFSYSSSPEERQLLLLLFHDIAGDSFPALVKAFLQQQPSAELLKDLIIYSANHGEERTFPELKHCFHHDDKRVQREMIRYVVKLEGKFLKDRLLDGLDTVHESLKVSIIRLLAKHAGGDETVLSALCDLAQKNDKNHELTKALVMTLRVFPHEKSVDVLNWLQGVYQHRAGSEQILLQIDRSLKTITPLLRHRRRHQTAIDEISFESDPLLTRTTFHKLAEIEEEVRKILQKGESRAAGRFLYEKARAAGRERDFFTAEKLRDRMLQVDPMALNEVVEFGQWLDEQRKGEGEPLREESWQNFRDHFSPEEISALQRVLRRESYKKGETIIEAGDLDEALFFFTSGNIGLNCLSGGDECFIRRLKPGEILGGTQFFAASFWTFSLRALSEVQVHLLDRQAFLHSSAEFPKLEQKLRQYCATHERGVAALLKTSGEDRREFPRYPASFLITNRLLDQYDARDSRDFQGELADISRKGISFQVKISSREHARLLLGREITSFIKNGEETIAEFGGIVVGVRQQDVSTNTFSVHVKLARKLEEATLQKIISLVNQ